MSRDKWNNAVASRDETRQQKRNAVLMAGARLFNDNGYEGTSLEDIAAALNITKRTIYYYVQSKEEILVGCLTLGFRFVSDIVARCKDTSVPPLERITLLLTAYCEWISTDFGACLVLTRETSLSKDKAVDLRRSKQRLDELLRDLIREGMAEGTIKPCDARLSAAAVFGAINWIPYWNRTATPTPHDQIADEYIALFVDGLRAPR